MKICTKCEVNKEPHEFNIRKRSKDGLKSWCKQCDALYYFATTTKPRKNKKIKIKTKPVVKSTPEEIKAKKKEYQKANLHIYRANAAKRRAIKLKATLTGFDEEIKQIYYKCPSNYHVDHIIPLQGKEVSGLHVPWNLQYLTAEENLSKGNRL